MKIIFNNRLQYISYKFIEQRVQKAFSPYTGKITYRIDFSKSTNTVYVSFDYKGEFYKIRISDHRARTRCTLDILLSDGSQPQIRTSIRRYLHEVTSRATLKEKQKGVR